MSAVQKAEAVAEAADTAHAARVAECARLDGALVDAETLFAEDRAEWPDVVAARDARDRARVMRDGAEAKARVARRAANEARRRELQAEYECAVREASSEGFRDEVAPALQELARLEALKCEPLAALTRASKARFAALGRVRDLAAELGVPPAAVEDALGFARNDFVRTLQGGDAMVPWGWRERALYLAGRAVRSLIETAEHVAVPVPSSERIEHARKDVGETEAETAYVDELVAQVRSQ